ncbi:hypothetical protein AAV35_000500 [Salimicrobium jeotgali]|uniref:Uncharacterized protein n=1 Tax=Salimicrobium jeotgali TaxID=1230341 RepID=K2H4T2_9BACI|nr:hypothetical protein AAV35_000500 [Salimicrobium jeotgali]EKE30880.1 hypothetical protein MJ3_11285 [Salimicrobium jeotgali]MBM7697655.1 putative integral membrane protein [Salimicrobium jeotgali]
MKRFTWLSYGSILLSIIPLFLFYGAIHFYFKIDFTILLIITFSFLILSIICGSIALFKRTERNPLAIIAILISISGGVVIGFLLMMAQM